MKRSYTIYFPREITAGYIGGYSEVHVDIPDFPQDDDELREILDEEIKKALKNSFDVTEVYTQEEQDKEIDNWVTKLENDTEGRD